MPCYDQRSTSRALQRRHSCAETMGVPRALGSEEAVVVVAAAANTTATIILMVIVVVAAVAAVAAAAAEVTVLANRAKRVATERAAFAA